MNVSDEATIDNLLIASKSAEENFESITRSLGRNLSNEEKYKIRKLLHIQTLKGTGLSGSKPRVSKTTAELTQERESALGCRQSNGEKTDLSVTLQPAIQENPFSKIASIDSPNKMEFSSLPIKQEKEEDIQPAQIKQENADGYQHQQQPVSQENSQYTYASVKQERVSPEREPHRGLDPIDIRPVMSQPSPSRPDVGPPQRSLVSQQRAPQSGEVSTSQDCNEPEDKKKEEEMDAANVAKLIADEEVKLGRKLFISERIELKVKYYTNKLSQNKKVTSDVKNLNVPPPERAKKTFISRWGSSVTSGKDSSADSGSDTSDVKPKTLMDPSSEKAPSDIRAFADFMKKKDHPQWYKGAPHAPHDLPSNWMDNMAMGPDGKPDFMNMAPPGTLQSMSGARGPPPPGPRGPGPRPPFGPRGVPPMMPRPGGPMPGGPAARGPPPGFGPVPGPGGPPPGFGGPPQNTFGGPPPSFGGGPPPGARPPMSVPSQYPPNFNQPPPGPNQRPPNFTQQPRMNQPPQSSWQQGWPGQQQQQQGWSQPPPGYQGAWQQQQAGSMTQPPPGHPPPGHSASPDVQEWYGKMRQWYEYAQYMQTQWNDWYSSSAQNTDQNTAPPGSAASVTISAPAQLKKESAEKTAEYMKANVRPSSLATAMETVQQTIAKMRQEKEVKKEEAGDTKPPLPADSPPPSPRKVEQTPISAQRLQEMVSAKRRRERSPSSPAKRADFTRRNQRCPSPPSASASSRSEFNRRKARSPSPPPRARSEFKPRKERSISPPPAKRREFTHVKLADRPAGPTVKKVPKVTFKEEKISNPRAGKAGTVSAEGDSDDDVIHVRVEKPRVEPPAKKPKAEVHEKECQVMIGNLPDGVKAAEVKELASKYGQVAGCRVGINKKDRSTFALVMMPDPVDAQAAARHLHHSEFKRHTLLCKLIEKKLKPPAAPIPVAETPKSPAVAPKLQREETRGKPLPVARPREELQRISPAKPREEVRKPPVSKPKESVQESLLSKPWEETPAPERSRAKSPVTTRKSDFSSTLSSRTRDLLRSSPPRLDRFKSRALSSSRARSYRERSPEVSDSGRRDSERRGSAAKDPFGRNIPRSRYARRDSSDESPERPAAPKSTGRKPVEKKTTGRPVTLWVGNIAKGTKAQDIKRFMSQFGNVINCKVGTSKKDEQDLFSIVTMENSEFGPPVATLTQTLHGTIWNGLRLSVKRMKDAE